MDAGAVGECVRRVRPPILTSARRAVRRNNGKRVLNAARPTRLCEFVKVYVCVSLCLLAAWLAALAESFIFFAAEPCRVHLIFHSIAFLIWLFRLQFFFGFGPCFCSGAAAYLAADRGSGAAAVWLQPFRRGIAAAGPAGWSGPAALPCPAHASSLSSEAAIRLEPKPAARVVPAHLPNHSPPLRDLPGAPGGVFVSRPPAAAPRLNGSPIFSMIPV